MRCRRGRLRGAKGAGRPIFVSDKVRAGPGAGGFPLLLAKLHGMPGQAQAGRLDQVWRGDRLDPAPSPWTLPYTDDIVPNWSGEAFEDRWKLTLLRRGSGD